jgi:Periplasmic binding protein
VTAPTEPARPWPRVSPLRRYGPLALVLLAVIGAGIVATVRSAGTSPPSRAPRPSSAGVPPTYAFAASAGRAGDYRWEPRCDPATGRIMMPTVYALPCVPAFSGHNGGSTWTGVSATSINVVYYMPPPNDLTVTIQGATGTQAANLATERAYVAMLNHVAEMYGRHVNLIPYRATGSSSDSVAAAADAVTVAQQLHAFASIGGPLQTPAYQDLLAQNHVLCLACALSPLYSSVQQNAPYVWGQTPTADSLLETAFSYVIDQLSGRDAIWAGDPAWHHRRRSFAVVNYVQNPPVPTPLTAELKKRLTAARVNMALSQSLTYELDLTTLTDQAVTIAAKLKASGATTVIFAGDPIMPIYLTRACAAVGYFPEWVITGTAFTDTTTLGRYYDQSEWAHAFGISSLAVPIPVQASDAYRLYRWWYGGRTVPSAKTAVLDLAPLVQLFQGIELAGPHLTPASFAEGLFRAPPAGGGPTTPLEAYGNRGAPPTPSYSSPADYTFIWYDATAAGSDEQGADGSGLLRYVQGGRRYRTGSMPSAPVPMFSLAGSVTSYSSPPDDRTPSYPPWPGSPAAGGAAAGG